MKNQQCPHCQYRLASTKLSYCPVCGMALAAVRTLQPLVSENDYASLGVRLLARLIDYALIGIIACLIDWGTDGALFESWDWFFSGVSGISQVTFSVWIGFILFFGYFVVFQSLSGRTPGKWLCQVIVLKKQEKVPGIFANLFREIGVGITIATGGWLLLIPIFSEKNRCFHDFISGVEVFHSPGA
ncbi:MAG: RDD family protein [SAR324 cluster bacterium]|nr:RDD family protein [SAR324 cluster bacterium]